MNSKNIKNNKEYKFEQVFLYVLSKVGGKPNVGETVLHKLMYFIDFDYFEKYEEQLTGVDYKKNHHGPIFDSSFINNMQKKGLIECGLAPILGYPDCVNLIYSIGDRIPRLECGAL